MPQKTLYLKSASEDTRPIYVAGTFNDWTAAHTGYRLQPAEEDDLYKIELDLPQEPERVEYKYTRGGWEAVELGRQGERTYNHTRFVSEDWSVPDRVEKWANAGLTYENRFLPIIEVIDEQFEIPSLIRTRRVAALLPHDYYSSQKHYPVLYLQDGQNLFDDKAPYGSWGVDKRLASMAERGWATSSSLPSTTPPNSGQASSRLLSVRASAVVTGASTLTFSPRY